MVDAVITNQAVHELRHKCHAPQLHQRVSDLLGPNGIYLVADHYSGTGGLQNPQLFMSVDEQRQALEQSGVNVTLLGTLGTLALYRAEKVR
ncbi:MAG: hypothetical protein KDI29_14795 [Pseudomonadales bacterium]|nr:hypothetical protein [Pseudomonadales bacterium]